MSNDLSKRAAEIAAEETKKLIDATPASGALYERAVRSHAARRRVVLPGR